MNREMNGSVDKWMDRVLTKYLLCKMWFCLLSEDGTLKMIIQVIVPLLTRLWDAFLKYRPF